MVRSDVDIEVRDAGRESAEVRSAAPAPAAEAGAKAAAYPRRSSARAGLGGSRAGNGRCAGSGHHGPMDDEWMEPDDQMGLWENQGRPLTMRWLLVALAEVAPSLLPGTDDILTSKDPLADLPIEVARYTGAEAVPLRVMHIDVRAEKAKPAAVVVTVT